LADTSPPASSSDTGILDRASSGTCLVNALSPPDFGANQISDGYSDGFCSVWVETFVNKLVQSFDVCFRQV
jgi:hypothetical protein